MITSPKSTAMSLSWSDEKLRIPIPFDITEAEGNLKQFLNLDIVVDIWSLSSFSSIGYALIDLSMFAYGVLFVEGWYNIIDRHHNFIGQMKIKSELSIETGPISRVMEREINSCQIDDSLTIDNIKSKIDSLLSGGPKPAPLPHAESFNALEYSTYSEDDDEVRYSETSSASDYVEWSPKTQDYGEALISSSKSCSCTSQSSKLISSPSKTELDSPAVTNPSSVYSDDFESETSKREADISTNFRAPSPDDEGMLIASLKSKSSDSNVDKEFNEDTGTSNYSSECKIVAESVHQCSNVYTSVATSGITTENGIDSGWSSNILPTVSSTESNTAVLGEKFEGIFLKV